MLAGEDTPVRAGCPAVAAGQGWPGSTEVGAGVYQPVALADLLKGYFFSVADEDQSILLMKLLQRLKQQGTMVRSLRGGLIQRRVEWAVERKRQLSGIVQHCQRSFMTRIAEHIESWMGDLANNAIEPGSALPAFEPPLVGIASGADDLFTFLKNDIGPEFYWTPQEAFSIAFPEEKVRADELSVIAWVLPQTEHTRLAHRKAQNMPSIEWSKARHYGEQVNEHLRRHVANLLQADGYRACAPVLLPQWSRALSSRYGFASCWSERHAAHVCGLGTFGLSDGLITPVGKAVRVGSIIVGQRLEPTARTYTKHNEWCLFQDSGKCLACMRRCPCGAISEAGHDKVKCKEYVRTVTAVHVEQEQLGFRVNSCGLCQTKVPCEALNPLLRKKQG